MKSFVIGVFFFLSLVASLSISADEVSVTISGRITNVADAEAYLLDDSYLQLIPLSPQGGVGFETDEKGRTTYESDITPTVPIIPSGEFVFADVKLAPGTYLIAAQHLEPFGMSSGKSPILVVKGTGRPAFVTLPPDQPQDSRISVGDAIIDVP